jgi:CheY-like chemotaxis protein
VVRGEDGASALAEIESEERYDLIFTDYLMSGVGRVELS